MKRAALLFDLLIIIFLLASCAANKQLHSNIKKVEGRWQLEKITTEGIVDHVSSQLFNEADFTCFIGSDWTFTNNHAGNYTITPGSGSTTCSKISRNINWYLYASGNEPMLLRFKRLTADGKEVDPNSSGFIFTLIELNTTNMRLRSDITFNGKPAAFIFNFVKG